MHVKKGDLVEVITGNDRGKTGEVKQALPKLGRVVVDGVNLRWRHRRPSQQNPKGERVQREASLHASNVRRIDAPGAKTKAKAKAARPAKAAKEPAGEDAAQAAAPAPTKGAAKKSAGKKAPADKKGKA